MSEVKGWKHSEIFEALVQGKLPAGFEISGRYQIRELLGQGGVGLVYRAFDQKLGEEIVLKILNPSLASDPDTVERFRREIKICRKIVHPNVIRIYDIGEFHGTSFISMEFVEGQNLKSLIRERGRLPELEGRIILRGILRGLAAAHEQEVIHRDLKSHNVMVNEEANVKLLDFGMARLHGMDQLTRIGDVLGSPPYMSPEQVRGLELDPRTDLYSLGIILFEMFTGQLPFVGQNPVDTVMMHLEREPARPRSLAPELSTELEHIILTCLQKQPADRFQSAEEILDALAPSPTKPSPAPPPAPPAPPPAWWTRAPVKNPQMASFAACMAGAIATCMEPELPTELLDLLELAAVLKNQGLPGSFRAATEPPNSSASGLLALALGLRYYTNRVKMRSAAREIFANQPRENFLIGSFIGEAIAILARHKSQDTALGESMHGQAGMLRDRLEKTFLSEPWLRQLLEALEGPFSPDVTELQFEQRYHGQAALLGLHAVLSPHPAGKEGFEQLLLSLQGANAAREHWRAGAAALAGGLWAFWNSIEAIPFERLQGQASSALAYDLGASLAAAAVVLDSEKRDGIKT